MPEPLWETTRAGWYLGFLKLRPETDDHERNGALTHKRSSHADKHVPMNERTLHMKRWRGAGMRPRTTTRLWQIGLMSLLLSYMDTQRRNMLAHMCRLHV